MFTALPRTFKSLYTLLFSILMGVVSVLVNPAATNEEMPQAPDDFTPVVRFAVTSDIHIKEEENNVEARRWAAMIDKSYELAQSDAQYPYLDAVCVAGDYTNNGSPLEYAKYKAVADNHIHAGTKLITAIGNHEFGYAGGGVYALHREVLGAEPDVHEVINGFHFVAVSYSQIGGVFGFDKQAWLAQQLKQAKSDKPDYPIFVFQHPHPFGTVYGSVQWGSPDLNGVYSLYPQVVSFSGHSHYAMGDPRSIWQGSFTALGTGSLSYMENENELEDGQFPEGYRDVVQFYIVEADATGSVRIRCYDLTADCWFGETYFIEKPADKNGFAYTYANRMRADQSPVFAGGAALTVAKGADGSYSVSFPAASDRFVVHDYKIKVTSGAKTVFSQSILSGYYIHPSPADYTVDIGPLETGKEYRVTVMAANAYAELSKPLTLAFAAQ